MLGSEIIMDDASSRFRYSTAYVFYAKVLLDRFLTFRVTFTSLTFCVLRDLKFSHSQFQAAKLYWRQLNYKIHLTTASKLVPFFHFIY